MKMIECSAGKGTMTAEACLECARGILPPCGLDFTLLKAIYGKNEDRRSEIHVTDMTGCLRKAYLSKANGNQPEMPHKRMAIMRGLAFHALMDDGSSESEIALSVLGSGWEVVGRADAIYKTHSGRMRLVDFKTTKDIYPDLVPYGEHEIQLNLYRHMMRVSRMPVPDELVIVYIASKTPECSKCRVQLEMTHGMQGETYFEVACPNCGKQTKAQHLGVLAVPVRVYGDDEIEEVFNHRASTLALAMKNGTLPKGEPGWICKYCTHECDVRQA